MKQMLLVLGLLVITPVLFASEGDMSIGGGLGFAMPFGDLSNAVDAGITLNLFGEYYFTDLLGIRGMMNYHLLSGEQDFWGYYDYYTVETDLKVFDILVDAAARFELTDKLYITAMGGMGAYISKWEVSTPLVSGSSENQTDIGVNLGGNFTYQLTRDWGIQGNLIYHMVNMDDWENWLDLTVTASYSL